MRCYAENYCKKDKSECNELCGGYRVLKALYTLSRIPAKYQYNIPLVPSTDDTPKFIFLQEFMEDILSKVEAGEGLYIWSDGTGNGKTTWATKIMGYYFRKIAFNSGLENEGLYIYLPTFLEDLRQQYSTPDPDFEEVLEMVTKCKLLIVDDIGAEKPSEWVSERLLSIINTRVANNRSTIYTSNIPLNAIGARMGERIKSRIIGSVTEVSLTGNDRRARV